jgi:hypothetical protein
MGTGPFKRRALKGRQIEILTKTNSPFEVLWY